MSILLIGAGRMGSALLKGWLKSGVKSITVVEPKPSPELRKLAKAKKITLFAAPSAVKTQAVGLRGGDQAAGAERRSRRPGGLRPARKAGALMISIAAGTSVAAMAKAWGKKARIIRAMPNTPGAIGAGITGLYAAKGVTPADKKRAVALLVGLGRDRMGGEGRVDRQRHRRVRFRARLSVPDGGGADRSRHCRRTAARAGREIRPRHGCRRRRAYWRPTNRRLRRCAKPSPVPAAPPRRRCRC